MLSSLHWWSSCLAGFVRRYLLQYEIREVRTLLLRLRLLPIEVERRLFTRRYKLVKEVEVLRIYFLLSPLTSYRRT